MTAEIFGLPPSSTYNADQALASAAQVIGDSALVIGTDTDGDLVIRSSRMSRAEALFLIEQARDWVMGR